jgi:hypothetical protein
MRGHDITRATGDIIGGMEGEKPRFFFRHRLSRESGEFRFFCSRCPAEPEGDATPGLRLTQVSEEVLSSYLSETGSSSISCAGCGALLVSR